MPLFLFFKQKRSFIYLCKIVLPTAFYKQGTNVELQSLQKVLFLMFSMREKKKYAILLSAKMSDFNS